MQSELKILAKSPAKRDQLVEYCDLCSVDKVKTMKFDSCTFVYRSRSYKLPTMSTYAEFLMIWLLWINNLIHIMSEAYLPYYKLSCIQHHLIWSFLFHWAGEFFFLNWQVGWLNLPKVFFAFFFTWTTFRVLELFMLNHTIEINLNAVILGSPSWSGWRCNCQTF